MFENEDVETPEQNPLEENFYDLEQEVSTPILDMDAVPMRPFSTVESEDIFRGGNEVFGLTDEHERNYVEDSNFANLDERVSQLNEAGHGINEKSSNSIKDKISGALRKDNWVAPMLLEQDSLSDTDFTEWHSSLQVGDAFSRVNDSTNSRALGLSQAVGYQSAGLQHIVAPAVDLGIGLLDVASKNLMHRAAGLTEFPATLFADEVDVVNGMPSIYGDQEATNQFRKKAAAFFIGNPLAAQLRHWAGDIPEEMQADIFNLLKQGEVQGAGKALAYNLAYMAGDLAFLALSGGAGAAILGASATGTKFSELETEGRVSTDQALANARGSGVVTGVLSNFIFLEKLKKATRLTASNFGVKTGREFARSVMVNTMKDVVFDGSLLVAAEASLAAIDYVTGVDENAFEHASERMPSAFIFGSALSIGFGVPIRAFGVRSRIKMANRTETIGKLFEDTVQSVESSKNPNKVMKNALAAADLALEKGGVNEVVYFSAEDAALLSQGSPKVAESILKSSELNGLIGSDTVSVPTEVALKAVLSADSPQVFIDKLRLESYGPSYSQARNFNNAATEFFSLKLGEAEKGPSILKRLGKVFKKDSDVEGIQVELAKELETFIAEADSTPVLKPTEAGQVVEPTLIKKAVHDEGLGSVPDLVQEKTGVARDNLDIATGMNRMKRVQADQASKKALLKEVDEVLSEYAFTADKFDDALTQVFEHGVASEFNYEKMHTDVYTALISEEKFQSLSKIFDSRHAPDELKLSKSSAKEFLSKPAYKKLKKNMPEILAEGDIGAPFEAYSERVGISPKQLDKYFNDAELYKMSKYETTDAYALETADKIAKVTHDTLAKYAEATSADNTNMVDYLLTSGKLSDGIDSILNPVEDKLLWHEAKKIETLLADEFTRRDSLLIKIPATRKEVKAHVQESLKDLGHKSFRNGSVVKQALAAEEVAARVVARAVKNKDLVEAYKARSEQLYARAMAKQAIGFEKVFRKADSVVKKITQNSAEKKLLKDGFDMDYTYAVRLALNENGVKVPKSSLTRAQDQLGVLARQDPLKADLISERVNRLIPDEVPQELSVREYLDIVEQSNEIMNTGKFAKNIEGLDLQVPVAVESLSKGIFKYISKINDEKTNGEFSLDIARRVSELNAERTNPVSTDVNSVLDVAGAVKRTSALATEASVGNKLKGSTNSMFSVVKLAYDFMFNLADRLEPAVQERFKGILNNMQRKESLRIIDQMERIDPFIGTQRALIQKNRKALAFPGRVKFTDNVMLNARELLAVLYHTGNTSNFAAISQRNFKKPMSVVKAEIQRLISDGTITKAHFEYVNNLWKFNESFLPEAQASHKKNMGTFFKEIEKDFVLKDIVPDEWGTIEGGYAPLKTDHSQATPLDLGSSMERSALKSSIAKAKEDFILEDPLFFAKAHAKGFEQSRAGEAGPALDLNINSYYSHYNQILNSIHTRDVGLQAAQIFRSPEVSKAIHLFDEAAVTDVINPWLQSYLDQTAHAGRLGDAVAEKSGKFWADTVLGIAQRNSVVQILGNVMTATLNPFELIKVVHYEGKGSALPPGFNYAYATARITMNMTKAMASGKLRDKVRTESPYLRTRYENQHFTVVDKLRATTKDISTIENTLLLRSAKVSEVKAAINGQARFLDHYTQMIVDTTTYIAARDSHFAQFKDYDRAIFAGEEAVQRLQPGYAPSERSPLMKNAYGSFLAQYSDWAIKSLSYVGGEARKINERAIAEHSILTYGQYAPLIAFGLILPTLGEDVTRGVMTGRLDLGELQEEFEEDPLGTMLGITAEGLIGSLARGPVVGQPLVGTGIGALTKLTGYKPKIVKPFHFSSLPMSQFIRASNNLAKDINYNIIQEYMELTSDTRKNRTPGHVAEDVLTVFGFSSRTATGPLIRKPVKYLMNLQDEYEDQPESIRETMNILTRGTIEDPN